MRNHLLVAAFLATTTLSPASAQEVGAVAGTVGQTQAVVGRVADESEDRMARGDRSWRSGAEPVRGTPRGNDRNDRMDRDAPPQERPQFQPQFQPQVQPQQQAQPQPRPDWTQSRQPPVNLAGPSGLGSESRDWRGNGGNRWDRDARQTPPQTPPVVAGSDWRRADGDRSGGADWRNRDRTYDDARVDRDRNADRRWNRNGDGVRDSGSWRHNGTWRDNRQNWGRPTWSGDTRWNQEWRNDRRYDWQRYRSTNRDLFRQPRYFAPFGFRDNYQRFSIGVYLDSILFGSRYRLSDAWRYRLPAAQWPYEWVRYYDDILLVDTRNGYVADVIYRFFW